MAKATTTKKKVDDLSWPEVFELSKKYLKIPLALLCVEMVYWFITQPSNTLVPIQISEAYIWNLLTNLLYGEGTATLTTNNGWLTQVNLHNENFPGVFNTVGLYVSDECAGVHEMLFISTLILMTDGVSQKLKFKSIVVMCSIVYVLNIVRLLAFYPIALDACAANPNNPSCLTNMWEYHEAIYSWGFLVVLVFMWLVWFWKVGGPSRAIDSTKTKEKSRIIFRKKWETPQFLILLFVALMLASATYSITNNEKAMSAKETLDLCEFSSLATNECMSAQNTWDNAIQTSWSLAAIGLLFATFTIFRYEKRNQDGSWPSDIELEEE